jgi:hypothetical protein
MPRTKKTPSSQSLAADATKGPNETPKGSGHSVAPSLEERVSRLEGLFAYLGEGILRSLPDRLTTDALIEILGDRDDVASRRAADALFEAKR